MSHTEKLNRDYYRGRFATHDKNNNGRVIDAKIKFLIIGLLFRKENDFLFSLTSNSSFSESKSKELFSKFSIVNYNKSKYKNIYICY